MNLEELNDKQKEAVLYNEGPLLIIAGAGAGVASFVYTFINDFEKYKKQQKSSEITEDDYKNTEKDIQKLTDDYIKEIDKIMERKEKELKEI